MSTVSQIEANRLNSQKSTGPRTAQGKAVSSQNAFKSGLDADSQFCYGEQRADFYRLQVEYFARFQPHSPEERFQVDSLIRNEWMLRRLFRAEAHLWEFHTSRGSRFDGVPLGEAFHNAHPEFMRLHRRITLFEKSYKDSFAQLQTLQQDRLAAQAQTPGVAASDPYAHPTEEELTYPGPRITVYGDLETQSPAPETPVDPGIGFVPESVGQAPSPAPDPLVRLPQPSAPPVAIHSTLPQFGFVPQSAHPLPRPAI